MSHIHAVSQGVVKPEFQVLSSHHTTRALELKNAEYGQLEVGEKPKLEEQGQKLYESEDGAMAQWVKALVMKVQSPQNPCKSRRKKQNPQNRHSIHAGPQAYTRAHKCAHTYP